ncbi:mechanosensitive ion channel family protein [uncultured Deefgea sp.]|uniref:mechanosensitive ion channel family protein n=1 Tax=uncultured Deefgea sp. TaxID=1304914 RepID=UPI002602B3CF|nr:mechanosensitive ion channel family protein [uncultured Deefgea sp.]
MDTWFTQLKTLLFDTPEVYRVLLAILVIVTVNALLAYALRQVTRLAQKSNTRWDDVLVHAARPALRSLVWVLGISYILTLIPQYLHVNLVGLTSPLRSVGVTLCLAWFLFRLIALTSQSFLSDRYERGESVDSTTVDALSKLGRLIVVIATALSILQTLGFSVSGVLAAGGIGGLAVGFAAKDLLANFFGGLTIYLDRPFSVGEWIRSPDKQIEGTVEKISWRHTRIRGFNKNPIYVPNAIFTTIVVENPSRMTHRRIRETIGLRYDDIAQVHSIVSQVKEMLHAHPEIDSTQTTIVNFNQFAASSLDIMLYTFTKTTDWVRFHAVKQDVLLQIAAIIEQHHAQIAFPTSTIHIQQEPPEA